MAEARHRLGDAIRFAESNYDALEGADALVVVTDWNEYRHPDFNRIKSLLRRPIVIDGRNLYDAAKMRALGFTYDSIGRGHAPETPQVANQFARDLQGGSRAYTAG
jgi:UDPglucose 6-dehydrogenase